MRNAEFWREFRRIRKFHRMGTMTGSVHMALVMAYVRIFRRYPRSVLKS